MKHLLPVALLLFLTDSHRPAMLRICPATQDGEAFAAQLGRVVSGSNKLLDGSGVILVMARTDCRVVVGFMPANKSAVAVALPLTGQIYMDTRRKSAPRTLIHELLHCAGLMAHEPSKRSIIYRYEAAPEDYRRILPHHVAALRALAKGVER